MTSLRRRVPDAAISEPDDHTVMDAGGAVRSIQAANVTMPEGDLEAIWTPLYLERLARTYWKYLSRVSLGLIRVEYTPTERRVVLLRSPFVLLRFGAPEYQIGEGRGIVRWRIRDGVLVARRDQGYLEIDVQRTEAEKPGFAQAHVEVEVANFYPAIATWVARWFYKVTQSRVHVLVTHGFLRSLVHRRLETSAVGRFDTDGRTPVNVGETPWLVVAAIVTAFVAAVAAAWRFIRSGR
ncbi:MAG TPA: hypothetical protein VFM58_20330 [Solirubrobacteraceae bacterium]|nr:hypothetical protein [Solirubrobacteraceae bacterium]